MISPTRSPSCLRCLASSFFRLLVTNSVAMADLTELVRYRTGSGSGLVTGVLSGDVGVGPIGSWVGDTGSSRGMTVYLLMGSPICATADLP